MLLGNVRCIGDVLARYQQKLILGTGKAILTIGPVRFAFIETYCGLFGRPFENHTHLQRLSLAFDLLDFGRARQVPYRPPLRSTNPVTLLTYSGTQLWSVTSISPMK